MSPKNLLSTPMQLSILTALLLATSISAKSCEIEQTQITFGDHFAPPYTSTSSYFTISTIIRGTGCNPKLNIIKPTGSQVSFGPSLTTPYSSKGLGYSAVSYIFTIPKAFGFHTYKWKITTSSFSSTIHNMPYLGASNAPGEAKVLILADMDLTSRAQPLVQAMKGWKAEDFDYILHAGDYAYNIESDKGKRGDVFFETLSQLLTADIPYYMGPGNHENYDHGKLFNFRLKMAGGGSPTGRGTHYESFTYKGVHWVGINGDYIFNYGKQDRIKILNWLDADLKAARSNPDVNFIAFFSHRPFYCPLGYGTHCKVFYHWRPFEIMLRKYKVELALFGHAHWIFRLKWQRDFKLLSSQPDDAPLFIVSGSNGNREGPSAIKSPMCDYIQAGESAWLKLTTTPTMITGEFIQSSNGKVLDKFEILSRKQREINKKKEQERSQMITGELK